MSRSDRGKGNKSGKLGKPHNPVGKNPNTEKNGRASGHEVKRAANVTPVAQEDHSDVTGSVPPQKESDEQRPRKPVWKNGAFREWVLISVATVTCGVMVWQNELTRAAVKASQDANDIARQSIREGQRAWISVDDIAIAGPLSFKSRRAAMDMTVTVKNVGAKPAINTNVRLQFASIYEGVHSAISACNSTPSYGYTLFPNASNNVSGQLPNVFTVAEPKPQPRRMRWQLTFSTEIEGCVTYQSPGDPDFHYTRFAATLMRSGFPTKATEDLSFDKILISRNVSEYSPAQLQILSQQIGHEAK